MRIERVTPFLMTYPLPEPLRVPLCGGEWTLFKRDAMLVRIETTNGLVGWAPGAASERAAAAIRDTVGPFLEGRTLADPDALRVLFLQEVQDPELVKVYCAVEIGLYDLLGRALGVPASELLGGRVRDRIRLYGSAGLLAAPENFAEEAAAIQETGFTAYKMRPAAGPERDVEAVERVRAATGPDFEVMVDGRAWWRSVASTYSFPAIEQAARGMARYRLCWLEEPWPADDHSAYRQLKAKGLVPLASGRTEPNEDAFLDLIQTRAIDYVEMTLVSQGGYPTGRLLLTEAAREGLRFAFHSSGTALELMAAAQLGICWPEIVAEWLEYPCYTDLGRPGMYSFPLAEEMLAEPLPVEQGDLVVPADAGLGVEINERVVERYPWIPGPEASW